MFRAVLGIHVTKVFFHVAFENTDELKKILALLLRYTVCILRKSSKIESSLTYRLLLIFLLSWTIHLSICCSVG